MGNLDITLRGAIQEIPPKFIQILTGKSATKLLDTSLPEVKDRREDILNLYKELNLEPEKIVKILKVLVNFVKKVLEE